MNKRTNIGDLEHLIGEEVNVAGWVDTVRDLKHVQFIVLKDNTGVVQLTNEKSGKNMDDSISKLTAHSTMRARGILQQNPGVRLNGYEIMVENIDIYSTPVEQVPIDENSSIDLRLDFRHVDLRRPEQRLIFEAQTLAEHAMREYWTENGFLEIHSPKLMSGASESGAELFTLDYFGEQASLAQSPQFYKQMAMAGGLERVFEIGPVFRANNSKTRRHDTEFTSVDVEMSWIDSHYDVIDVEQDWLHHVLTTVYDQMGDKLADAFGADPTVPTLPFPVVPLSTAHEIVRSMGHIVPEEKGGDLDPVAERLLSRHIKKTLGHDFVFVTDYPASLRPFYHMKSESKPELTKSFDLIWNGVEVTTGAQREHRYDILQQQAIDKAMSPESIKDYLGFFKHGCPPHGGYGFGLTRMLMQITNQPSVKEVTYMHRGPTRLRP